MRKDQIKALSGCHLFNNIEIPEIERLMDTVPGVLSLHHKESIVRFQGDVYEDLLIILSGELSAEILNPDGKKMTIEHLRRSSAIATAVLFAADNTLPVTLKAVEETEILSIPRKAVLRFCGENEQFLFNYLQDNGDKVIFLAEKIRLFRFKSIPQKLSGYLLGLAIKQGADSVRLTYSLEQVSDLFGVARPSLSRVLSELTEKGVVKKEGKLIHILDREELEFLLEGE